MAERLALEPVVRPISAVVRPPGSKSITNRALVCAALADGDTLLEGALDSDDTRVMIESLRRLGLRLEHDPAAGRISIAGCGGRLPISNADLFVGNSGTTIRFLTAMLAACHGRFRLEGVARMHERPIGDLLAALVDLGGKARSELENHCPPVIVEATGLAGGVARIRGDISSQFLSGLLMAAPYAKRDVVLAVEGELVSQPYVQMTLGVMKAFGVTIPGTDLRRLEIAAPRHYRGCPYSVEPDASAASYFWGAAAITGGSVTVEGLTRDSLQGDVSFCDCLEKMGCEVTYLENGIQVKGAALRGITVNMNAISDTAQTLAAVALFAEGPTTIEGVGHIRHKETDRIGDLARELRRLGAEVDEFAEGLRITPRRVQGAELETYRDHRMAMSLALVGLKVPGVVIRDPACVDKTYPRYFDDYEAMKGG